MSRLERTYKSTATQPLATGRYIMSQVQEPNTTVESDANVALQSKCDSDTTHGPQIPCPSCKIDK